MVMMMTMMLMIIIIIIIIIIKIIIIIEQRTSKMDRDERKTCAECKSPWGQHLVSILSPCLQRSIYLVYVLSTTDSDLLKVIYTYMCVYIYMTV